MGDYLRLLKKVSTERKKALKKALFAQPVKKGELTDALRLAKLESLVIALYDAVVNTNVHPLLGCSHERWAFFTQEHEFELSHLGAAAVEAMIRRDKGVCQICKGSARVCYYRHAEGRSCG